MRHPCRVILAAATLTFALCACTPDGDPPQEPAAPASGGASVPAPAPARNDSRDAKNFIEVQVDGKTFRADTASSFAQRFQGDPSQPRYDVTMSSGWIGSSEMSIVELQLLNIDGESRTLTLDGEHPHGPAVVLGEIPGRRNTRWRSVSGTLRLQFDDVAVAGRGMDRIEGRFDASLRKLHAHGDAFSDDGEHIDVSGRFHFKAGVL